MDYGVYRIEISGMPHFFTVYSNTKIILLIYKHQYLIKYDIELFNIDVL